MHFCSYEKGSFDILKDYNSITVKMKQVVNFTVEDVLSSQTPLDRQRKDVNLICKLLTESFEDKNENVSGLTMLGSLLCLFLIRCKLN